MQPHPHLYTPQVCEYSWLLCLYSRVMLHYVFWLVLCFTIILCTIPQNAYNTATLTLLCTLTQEVCQLQILRSAFETAA